MLILFNYHIAQAGVPHCLQSSNVYYQPLTEIREHQAVVLGNAACLCRDKSLVLALGTQHVGVLCVFFNVNTPDLQFLPLTFPARLKEKERKKKKIKESQIEVKTVNYSCTQVHTANARNEIRFLSSFFFGRGGGLPFITSFFSSSFLPFDTTYLHRHGEFVVPLCLRVQLRIKAHAVQAQAGELAHKPTVGLVPPPLLAFVAVDALLHQHRVASLPSVGVDAQLDRLGGPQPLLEPHKALRASSVLWVVASVRSNLVAQKSVEASPFFPAGPSHFNLVLSDDHLASFRSAVQDNGPGGVHDPVPKPLGPERVQVRRSQPPDVDLRVVHLLPEVPVDVPLILDDAAKVVGCNVNVDPPLQLTQRWQNVLRFSAPEGRLQVVTVCHYNVFAVSKRAFPLAVRAWNVRSRLRLSFVRVLAHRYLARHAPPCG